MSNSNKKDDFDSNNVDTKLVVKIIIIIALFVFGFYFHNFHHGLSEENGDWGTFGDYAGGILNPIIAGFAFYLIAKTYDLQKKELEATRELLKISTDAQIKQVELTALSALLNAKYTQKSFFSNIAQSIG